MRWSAVLLLFVASPLWAAPPDVPRELKCEPGQVVRIVAKGQKVGTLKNFPDDAAFFDELVSKGNERRFMFQATRPGVYVVGFFTIGEDTGVACTITVGKVDPAPEPKPKPKPDDPDPVQPVAAKVVVVVVEETRNRTPEQGKVLFDKSFRDWLKAGGHEIELCEASDAATKNAGYLPFAEKVGLPAVLVFDAAASGPVVPLATFKLPDSGAAWKTLVERTVKK